MLGNSERSGYEKKAQRCVRDEAERRGNERERVSRDIKETRAVGKCWDDNVGGNKTMLGATIRFICALWTTTDAQRAVIRNHHEDGACINMTAGGERQGVKTGRLHIHGEQGRREEPLMVGCHFQL